jgi:hypothetical protein
LLVIAATTFGFVRPRRAHDPGQGVPIARAHLTAIGDGTGLARLTVEPTSRYAERCPAAWSRAEYDQRDIYRPAGTSGVARAQLVSGLILYGAGLSLLGLALVLSRRRYVGRRA